MRKRKGWSFTADTRKDRNKQYLLLCSWNIEGTQIFSPTDLRWCYRNFEKTLWVRKSQGQQPASHLHKSTRSCWAVPLHQIKAKVITQGLLNRSCYVIRFNLLSKYCLCIQHLICSSAVRHSVPHCADKLHNILHAPGACLGNIRHTFAFCKVAFWITDVFLNFYIFTDTKSKFSRVVLYTIGFLHGFYIGLLNMLIHY